MATTTPNFGWAVPTSSDLVKNGATAIETLGDAIDASLVDLKGGTTSQVLTKASATDMDFTWSTPSNPTPKSFNYVINGGMDISQRGTSFAPTSGLYTLDRWYGQRYGTANGTVSQVNTSDTTNLPQITKAMRIASNSGSTASGTVISSPFENAQTQQLIGQTVTFSFYIRKGANYSGTSCPGVLAGGTGTDQSLNSGFTGQTTLLTVNPTLTTTWQRVQGTVTIGSTYTQLGIYFTTGGTGTAGANDWVEITGVQLELGSTATPFQRAGGTIQGELAACQRYYNRLGNTVGNSAQRLGVGPGVNSTTASVTFYLPVNLRTATTSIDFSGLQLYQGTATYAVTAAAVNSQSTQSPNVNLTVASGLTGAQFYEALTTSTAGYIAFNAEL